MPISSTTAPPSDWTFTQNVPGYKICRRQCQAQSLTCVSIGDNEPSQTLGWGRTNLFSWTLRVDCISTDRLRWETFAMMQPHAWMLRSEGRVIDPFYLLDTNPLSDTYFASKSSQSVTCPFIILMVMFDEQNFLLLRNSSVYLFFLFFWFLLLFDLEIFG